MEDKITLNGKVYNREQIESDAKRAGLSTEEFLSRIQGADGIDKEYALNLLATAIEDGGNKIHYDAHANNILSFKDIASRILVGAVEEFKDMDPRTVFDEYFASAIEVGTHHLHLCQSDKIEVGNCESKVPGEHKISFDVRFRVRNPKPYGEKKLGIVINFEFQNVNNPGYHLVARGIYYTARLISEQYGAQDGFVTEDYDRVEKVYSIWICPTSVQKRKGTVTRYRYEEECLLGETRVERKVYDLSEIILLYLPYYENRTSDELLNMLGVLFSPTMDMHLKFDTLQNEFGIKLTRDVEKEVESMSYSKEVVESDWKARSDKAVAERDAAVAKCGAVEAMCSQLTKDITSKDSTIQKMAIRMYRNGMSAEDISKDFGIEKDKLERILGEV